MAWIELHTVLIRHRKLKKLARELKIKPVQGVGHITTLWSNVLELAEDGNITKWSIEDIADYSNWEGSSIEYYNALVNKGDGWIDEKGGIRLIHDWWDYAGRYLKTKYRNTDPDKLEYIMSLYKKTYDRRSKDGLKTVNQPTYLTYQSIDKLLSEFYVSYKQKFNRDYVKETTKDRSVMKLLLKSVPEEEIRRLIPAFFGSEIPFILQSGYTIGVFKSVINKLRTTKTTYG